MFVNSFTRSKKIKNDLIPCRFRPFNCSISFTKAEIKTFSVDPLQIQIFHKLQLLFYKLLTQKSQRKMTMTDIKSLSFP
ncbi:hypothetical protein NPIL_216071 [Nephila pilipes]|uniref:Uncharacterized protein n=1 Tax=Nephila pilipes TaxID=299642 RepID=A0A8X6NEI4_NEPPI|nr:hypothetical protein NPIL_216071 [Nephila pilipes]